MLGFAGTRHLDHPDGELADDQALRGQIVRTCARCVPTSCCCPDPTAVFFGDGYFNHHDHRVTGWATLDAVAPAAATRTTSRSTWSTSRAAQVAESLLR